MSEATTKAKSLVAKKPVSKRRLVPNPLRKGSTLVCEYNAEVEHENGTTGEVLRRIDSPDDPMVKEMLKIGIVSVVVRTGDGVLVENSQVRAQKALSRLRSGR